MPVSAKMWCWGGAGLGVGFLGIKLDDQTLARTLAARSLPQNGFMLFDDIIAIESGASACRVALRWVTV